MKRTRTDLLNLICEIRKPQRYLEIGIQSGENFKAVNCPVKVGVDPDPNVEYQTGLWRFTSDQFFEDWGRVGSRPNYPFDLIFIDGDHSAEQTDKDIGNAILHLNKGGLIVCHDARPH